MTVGVYYSTQLHSYLRVPAPKHAFERAASIVRISRRFFYAKIPLSLAGGRARALWDKYVVLFVGSSVPTCRSSYCFAERLIVVLQLLYSEDGLVKAAQISLRQCSAKPGDRYVDSF